MPWGWDIRETSSARMALERLATSVSLDYLLPARCGIEKKLDYDVSLAEDSFAGP